MAVSARHVSGGAETYFAKKLASNEKTVRDKAVKKLRTWVSSRCSVSLDLTENDVLKLWKGLFYCMWMSDKPKVQEELAETMAQLIHSFQITTAAIDFLDGFYQTICREWHGIDRLRLDKFYLLIRKFVYQSMMFLKNHGWENEIMETYNKMLENGSLSTSNKRFLVPDGVKTHLIQVYLEELLKCGISQVPASALLHLLQPFIRLLATSNNKVITRMVCAEIFDELLKMAREEEQDGPSLKADFQALSDQFFIWAGRKDILARNRDILYEYINKFKIITKGKDCDVKQVQEDDGLNESTRKSKQKCNGSIEESVHICDPVVVDIQGNKQSKIVAKKVKKGEKRKQKRDSNMSSSATKETTKKRSKKNEISSEDCDGVVNDCKVSVEDSVDLCEDSDIKGKHDIPFLSECVEENKLGKKKKKKGRKRKSDNNEGSEEVNSSLHRNEESVKKRKRVKSAEDKICEKVRGSDAIAKDDKKKKKLKNKSVVSNEVSPFRNDNVLKGKLAIEVGHDENSEMMSNTFDSLDGSYLSTLLNHARGAASFKGIVNKGAKANEDKSPVQDTSSETNIEDTPRIHSSAESLSQYGVRLSGDIYASEKIPEEAKIKDNKVITESVPLATFLLHSRKKVKANTKRGTQESKKSILENPKSTDKKKVRIELSKNTSHTTRDHIHNGGNRRKELGREHQSEASEAPKERRSERAIRTSLFGRPHKPRFEE